MLTGSWNQICLCLNFYVGWVKHLMLHTSLLSHNFIIHTYTSRKITNPPAIPACQLAVSYQLISGSTDVFGSRPLLETTNIDVCITHRLRIVAAFCNYKYEIIMNDIQLVTYVAMYIWVFQQHLYKLKVLRLMWLIWHY